MPGSRGWQFRYEPNVLKQIEERKAKIPIEDAKARVLAEVHGYFSGPTFTLRAWPNSAKQVADSATLQLALCEEEKLARSVCDLKDDSDPQAPIPRTFRNAILAVAPSPAALNQAVDYAQRLIAAEKLEKEHERGESGKLVREQIQRVAPEFLKQFRLQASRAFDRVVLADGKVYTLDEKYQVSDEEMLRRPQGQVCLRTFLDDKDLIYKAGDALDVSRFMKDVLPGATPTVDAPDVFTAKAVHERFLSAGGLRLVPDGGVVRETLKRTLKEGKIAIRLADGRAYDSEGCVGGVEGMRRRVEGSLTSFALDDAVLVSPIGSRASAEWRKVTEPGERGKKPPIIPKPPVPERVQALSWEKAAEYAADRPLLKLQLKAGTPVAARTLASLAQPFGAEKLSLTVRVDGQLKGGGIVKMLVEDVRLNHPAKPLDIARTLFTALEEGGFFEAGLALDFGTEGRLGLGPQLSKLADDAPENVEPEADFGKPVGGKK
jgi:hypothetical protein